MTSTSPAQPRTATHPADLIEPGTILRNRGEAFAGTTSGTTEPKAADRHDVVVIGAGQAGLSVSYHLKRKGIDHVVLDGSDRIGDVWRNRWDSLRLFTPAKFDGLDGLPFPAGKDDFPTKDEMADYLEGYAAEFALPVRLGTRADRLHRANGRYRVETSRGRFEADQVVIAAASYQTPKIPAFARELVPDLVQLHSRDYRNPGQLPDGPVLLVGAGNSGAEIAMDLGKSHEVILSGREVGHVPFDIAGFWGRKFLVRLVTRGLFHHVLTMRTPMGRRVRDKMHGHGLPLIRTRPGQLERAGVRRIGRIAGVRNGRPVTAEGSELRCASVVWCTGFDPGFNWIDLPVLDADGMPRHRFGRAHGVDGLYFVGMHFQFAMSSTMIAGVGRDARRVVSWIDRAMRP